MTERPINDPSINTNADNPIRQRPVTEGLVPGDVIELADIRELVAFEDVLASSIDPQHDPELWRSRPNVGDLIRPPKFNGTIANIELAAMAEPYERLLDAPERGWKSKLQKGSFLARMRLSPNVAERVVPKFKGFVFTADAKSSGRGTIGQIHAELWYYPFPPQVRNGGASVERKGKTMYGEEIVRVVTQPKLERERFIALDTNSRRIGLEQLRKQMTHPISTPMRA